MIVPPVNLVDFVLARTAKQEDADHDAFLAEVPDSYADEAAEAWERLARTQWQRMSIALRQLGWLLCDFPGLRPLLAREAAKYAYHPDYREEWRS